ncbi:kinase-like protein [Pholiota conissans]|uniref:Kinase-like protein n=1 Tax=Pholiota conissans TaxID=109636 RepID=A0A9P5YRG8_9AGAR|nr:kinase-like protein [Pholiota conissans]
MESSKQPELDPLPVSSWDNKSFSEYVHRTREELVQLRMKFSLWGALRDVAILPGGMEVWYGDSANGPYYVKISGGPGTLAFDIMCCRADIPRYNCSLAISGDVVQDIEPRPFIDLDDCVDPDLEDCSEEIAKLPLIDVDPEKHFIKNPTYRQEIRNLLQCQGSRFVVQLLGKSMAGELVFDRVKSTLEHSAIFNSNNGRIQNIKRWMLEAIDGVAYLHSQGIVHRDLTAKNILDPVSSPLVICDLQCLNSTFFCRPFEHDGSDLRKFSYASDIFALGAVLWQCCFYNAPLNRYVMLEYAPPPPFRRIFQACTAVCPEERPTLPQLKAMYEAIVIEN